MLILTSAVEPLRPRRERRRVASHRKTWADQPEAEQAETDPTGSEPASTDHLETDASVDAAAASVMTPDPFAGRGYADLPGLRWGDDREDSAAESDAAAPLLPPSSLFEDAVVDVEEPTTPGWLLPGSLVDPFPDLADLGVEADEAEIASLGEWRLHRPLLNDTSPLPQPDAPLASVSPISPPADGKPARRTRRLHIDGLPTRLRLSHISDDVAMLSAKIERFSVRNEHGDEIDCVVRPTLGWSPDDFGGNRRHDLTWVDAEQLVLSAWQELSTKIWIDGARLEAWMRVDGVGVFVPMTLDGSCTVWKFANAFRSAIELSHR